MTPEPPAPLPPDPWADWVGRAGDPLLHGAAAALFAAAAVGAVPGGDDAAGTDDGHAPGTGTYGADDVLADQLDALGAVSNTSDGTLSADGTNDYDWT